MENSLNPFLSFAICTYNRAFIITECLHSIVAHDGGEFDFEVLIVDNNSTDNTEEVIHSFIENNKNFRYIFEKEQGLSHARNRAMKEAKGEWIIFIDDDAKLRKDYFFELKNTISTNHFDCFGGPYIPWYPFGKTKWLPVDFGSKSLILDSIGLISGKNGLLSGGNFAIKTVVLKGIGGFNPFFGMKGNKTAYGEEDEIQRRLLSSGKKIGFNPRLMIEHAVLKEKLIVKWHFQAAYQRGFTREGLFSEKRNILNPFLDFIKSSISAVVKRIPISLYNLIRTKDYYYQNAILDVFLPLAFYLGSCSYFLKK